MDPLTEARRLLSQQIRRLVDGLISYEEYERRVDAMRYESSLPWDEAMDVFHQFIAGSVLLSWADLDRPLRGRQRVFRPQDRKLIARWILFLRTDLRYEWTSAAEWQVEPGCLGNLMVRIGMIPRSLVAEQYRNIWPFIRDEDFDNARATYHLLGAAA